MESSQTIKLIFLLIVMSSGRAGPALSDSALNTPERCASLQRMDFASLEDAPTQVISAQIGQVEGAGATQYCEVQAYIAPTVGVAVRLPLKRWNKKLLQLGCGGHCGSTAHIHRCNSALARGYACVVTDGGHRSSGNQALWAYNNWQGQIDYFIRASHVTALAGKAIVARYYGERPRHSYFMGCSAGGREAMMQAQRFPWDHDGIIAGCPSLSQTTIRMNLLWSQRALSDVDRRPLFSRTEIEALHQAVISRCDMIDGIKDGVLEDPRTCDFDPALLQCHSGKHNGCWSAAQVDAVKKVYRGATSSDGNNIIQPGALMGSEKTWSDWFLGTEETGMSAFIQEAFRYYAFVPNPGVSWRLEDFDFDHDYQRLTLADSLYAASNPDLRRFKAAGGKLLAYAGWNDAAGMPLPVIDYYEASEKIMGGRAIMQEFFRLFMIPGMDHCGGGDGASTIDYLHYLDRWVEQGSPPDELQSYRLLERDAPPANNDVEFPPDARTIEFSRPVYPYPVTARYRGYGDPKDASSFTASHPE